MLARLVDCDGSILEGYCAREGFSLGTGVQQCQVGLRWVVCFTEGMVFVKSVEHCTLARRVKVCSAQRATRWVRGDASRLIGDFVFWLALFNVQGVIDRCGVCHFLSHVRFPSKGPSSFLQCLASVCHELQSLLTQLILETLFPVLALPKVAVLVVVHRCHTEPRMSTHFLIRSASLLTHLCFLDAEQ